MPKISIYLDDKRLEEIEQLVKNNSHLTSRSALISFLIEQEIARENKRKMIEAAKEMDELGLGWNNEEEECAVTDMEVSG